MGQVAISWYVTGVKTEKRGLSVIKISHLFPDGHRQDVYDYPGLLSVMLMVSKMYSMKHFLLTNKVVKYLSDTDDSL